MGAAWFEREQWERLRAVASDPGEIEESYDDWCAVAERSIREFESEGMRIERVPNLRCGAGPAARPLQPEFPAEPREIEALLLR